MAIEELGFDAAGARLAAKRWRNGARPVLALHGWLDNAASFDVLAPLLRDADVVALDLPGHGHSDHRPPQGSYNIWDDLPDILRVADQLGWSRFHLLGHSRGAIISALLAAALPERVASIAMLDALTPTPVPVGETYAQLGRFLNEHLYSKRGVARYDSVDDALQMRCKMARMSERAARPIVERGIVLRDGAWSWRADPRLHFASAFKLNEDHNRELLERLAVLPHLILLAQRGVGRDMRDNGELPGLQKLHWELLGGSHHFHMEEEADTIAERLVRFWRGLDVSNP